MLTGVRILPGGEGISAALGITLENGASLPGGMTATECLVTEAPEKKEKATAPTPPEDY
jgi:hypothetical protein